MINRHIPAVILLWLLSVFSGAASAVIEIEITKGGESAIPIAVVPLGWNGAAELPEDIAGIISADLARSGKFAPLPRSELLGSPVSGSSVNYANWRLSGADYLVMGSVFPDGPNYRIEAQILDVIQQRLLSGIRFSVTDETLRSAAHQIADEAYEKILGQPGAFNTQIAYVSVQGPIGERSYSLELSDSDGHGAQPMLVSPRPIISPSWAPDGIRIAYVSFEDRERSAIFVQDRLKGSRQKLISRDGINSSPAWSPDGRSLAVTLSYEGNAELYLIDVATGVLRRLTHNDAIDIDPAWVDNQTLVFTSDRSGGPQLYELSLSSGRAQRLTYEGSYNTNPSVSPDGRHVAFVHRSRNGQYQIAVIERRNKLFRTLTNGALDESPSFAPNGQMIIYATTRGGQGTLGAVSLDGDIAQSLSLSGGSVRDPAWSPYVR